MQQLQPDKEKLKRIIDDEFTGSIWVDQIFFTVIVLSRNLKHKQKELLLLIYRVAKSSGRYKRDSNKSFAYLTITDFEKLGTYKKTSSVLLNELHELGAITWNKEKHTIKINLHWFNSEILQIPEDRIYSYRRILFYQDPTYRFK